MKKGYKQFYKIKNILKGIIVMTMTILIAASCGNKQNDEKQVIEGSKTEEVSAVNHDIDQKVVDITLQNVKDYFDIETVEEVDPFGEKTGTRYAYLKSKMYDEGWVIKEFSDFAIKTKVIEASQDAIYFTGDDFTIQIERCKNDVIENFIDAKGTVTYVPIESVKNYSYDDKAEERTIELQNGEKYTISQYPIYPFRF